MKRYVVEFRGEVSLTEEEMDVLDTPERAVANELKPHGVTILDAEVVLEEEL